jgi:orotidine-5'-phosphate decarboxylase
MTKTQAIERICVALDVPDAATACSLAERLKGHVGFVKVGMELYTAEGPPIVRALTAKGMKVFLDLKFHDIPNTVAGVSRVVSPFGVSIFDVHASGGQEMMRASLKAASDSAANAGAPRPLIIGNYSGLIA